MRPTWDEYFMKITELVAERSTCLRRKVGAVIVKRKRIITTGYNGAPSGLAHCEEVGCIREQLHIQSGQRQELCRGIHAEQNAIIQAAVMGDSIEGGTLYCTTRPCTLCAKMLINSGIKRIVYKGDYPDDYSLSLLNEAGVQVSPYTSVDRHKPIV